MTKHFKVVEHNDGKSKFYTIVNSKNRWYQFKVRPEHIDKETADRAVVIFEFGYQHWVITKKIEFLNYHLSNINDNAKKVSIINRIKNYERQLLEIEIEQEKYENSKKN
jgi:hypothetical protein